MTKLYLASYYDGNRLQYRTFDTLNEEEKSIKIIEPQDLSDLPIHGVFLPFEVKKEDYFANYKDHLRHLKAVELPEGELVDLEKLNLAEGIQKYLKYLSPILLRENLNTLSQLFPTLTHLKQLFPNERTTFFEELWHILNKNLGSSQLKIIFNHLESSQEESQKKKLIQVIVEGHHTPNPVENSDLGSELMKHYEKQFHSNFEVVEWDTEEGRLVILAQVHSSPCIIMSESIEFTFFQKSLLKALFDGLNQ